MRIQRVQRLRIRHERSSAGIQNEVIQNQVLATAFLDRIGKACGGGHLDETAKSEAKRAKRAKLTKLKKAVARRASCSKLQQASQKNQKNQSILVEEIECQLPQLLLLRALKYLGMIVSCAS